MCMIKEPGVRMAAYEGRSSRRYLGNMEWYLWLRYIVSLGKRCDKKRSIEPGNHPWRGYRGVQYGV